MRPLLIAAAFVALTIITVSRWIRGWRDVIRQEQASAVVHDLAESTRRLHHAHQAAVLGRPDDDGPEAA